jgi:DNA-binding CsgD family transcriptional regulator
LEVLAVLRRVIGFDAYVWLVTDPETSVGSAPLARVHLGSGNWLTLRADRLDSTQPVPERDIAVSIETTASGGRLSLFTRACGLSSRESELLGHVVAGAATRDIAQQMFVSEHAVHDHLKSIFTKTDTRTRKVAGATTSPRRAARCSRIPALLIPAWRPLRSTRA